MQRLRMILAVGAAAAATAVSCGEPYADGGSPKTAKTAKTEKAAPSVPVTSAPAHGFGDAIQWESFESGLARAKSEGKPMMMVAHADWCPRCKELKPSFFDPKVSALSRRFVMVNVDVDATPESQAPPYTPDGSYVPRVMFVDPKTGSVDASLLNERRTRTRYFYTPGDDLVAVMKKALSRHERT